MRDHYTSAQFTRGLRESRDEERQKMLDHIFKKICASTDAAVTEALAELAKDVRHGEHAPGTVATPTRRIYAEQG